jgi:hypothetical protein
LSPGILRPTAESLPGIVRLSGSAKNSAPQHNIPTPELAFRLPDFESLRQDLATVRLGIEDGLFEMLEELDPNLRPAAVSRSTAIFRKDGAPCPLQILMTCHFFESMSKHRKGFPSETHVRRGVRIVHGGKELEEKLGRNDLCLCGSGKLFRNCCLASGRF